MSHGLLIYRLTIIGQLNNPLILREKKLNENKEEKRRDQRNFERTNGTIFSKERHLPHPPLAKCSHRVSQVAEIEQCGFTRKTGL